MSEFLFQFHLGKLQVKPTITSFLQRLPQLRLLHFKVGDLVCQVSAAIPFLQNGALIVVDSVSQLSEGSGVCEDVYRTYSVMAESMTECTSYLQRWQCNCFLMYTNQTSEID